MFGFLRSAIQNVRTKLARARKGTVFERTAPKRDLSRQEIKTLVSLAKRVLWHNHETRRQVQARGVNVVPASFYSEIPTLDEIDGAFEYQEAIPFQTDFIDVGASEGVVKDLTRFAEEFDPPVNAGSALQFGWSNPAFSGSDAMTYYAMVRRFRPKTVLEIGSGYSTLVALEAAKRNSDTRVKCIEPFPMSWLKKLDIDLIEKPAQTIDASFMNRTLCDGDILFIDSTHTVKCGSDVVHLYLRILPYIQHNVIVHVHDIYLPYGMPKKKMIENSRRVLPPYPDAPASVKRG